MFGQPRGGYFVHLGKDCSYVKKGLGIETSVDNHCAFLPVFAASQKISSRLQETQPCGKSIAREELAKSCNIKLPLLGQNRGEHGKAIGWYATKVVQP